MQGSQKMWGWKPRGEEQRFEDVMLLALKMKEGGTTHRM